MGWFDLAGDWLDRSIVFSFDRTGFTRHRASFDPSDVPVDLTGRVCLVTGADAGLGRAATAALAGMGAEVWMLCRDATRGARAADQIAREVPHADLAITWSAMHPGWADTPGVKVSLPRLRFVTQRILRTAEEGADTMVWLAACRRLAGHSGRFWFDRRPVSTHVTERTRESAADRAAIWHALHRWAGVPDRTG